MFDRVRVIVLKFIVLVSHYFGGPLAGFDLCLTVDDYLPKIKDYVVSGFWLVIAAELAVRHRDDLPLVRFAVLVMFLPVCLYAFVGISRIVIEYRAYLSLFGIAILASSLSTLTPLFWIPILAIAVIFALYTRRRNRIFSNPLLFWTELYRVSPSPDTMINYSYQLIQSDQSEKVQDLVLTTPNYRDDPKFLVNLAISVLGPHTMNMDEIPAVAVERALRILEEVTTRWPADVDGWRNLATMHYYNHQLRRAIVSYNHAVELRPADGLSWFGLGVCHLEMGNFEYATECLRHAYEIQPNMDEIRVKFMEALSRSGKKDEFDLHQQILADSNMVFVTRDMLSPEQQEKYDRIIAEEEAQRRNLN